MTVAAAVSLPSPEREPLIALSHVSKDYDTGGGVDDLGDGLLTALRGNLDALLATFCGWDCG